MTDTHTHLGKNMKRIGMFKVYFSRFFFIITYSSLILQNIILKFFQKIFILKFSYQIQENFNQNN